MNDQAFWITAALGFASLLVKPEETFWRIVIISGLGIAVLMALLMGKSEDQDSILTLNGEVCPGSGISRKLKRYTFGILATVIFAVATWPTKQMGIPGDAVMIAIPAFPQIEYPTHKAIPPATKPESDSKIAVIGVLAESARADKPVKPVAQRPNAPSNLTATAN